MSGPIQISNTISPFTANRVMLSACGQGNTDENNTFCISAYTSGPNGTVGNVIQSTIPPYTGTLLNANPSQIATMQLWSSFLKTENTDFAIYAPQLSLYAFSSNLNIGATGSVIINAGGMTGCFETDGTTTTINCSNINIQGQTNFVTIPTCPTGPSGPTDMITKSYVDMFQNSSITPLSISGGGVAVDLTSLPFKTFSLVMNSNINSMSFTNGVINGNYTIYLTCDGTPHTLDKVLGINVKNNLSGNMQIGSNAVFILKIYYDGTKYMIQFINFT